MDARINSRERNRVVGVAIAIIVLIAILISYTVVSVRKATDDVIASVSGVYMRELSNQVVSHVNVGLDGKFGQMESVAAGLAAIKPTSAEEVRAFLSAQVSAGGASFYAARTSDGSYIVSAGVDSAEALGESEKNCLVSFHREGDEGRTITLMGEKIVLFGNIEPLTCGDVVITDVVSGFDPTVLSARLDLDTLGGFSRISLVTRDGSVVHNGKDSRLAPDGNLFDLMNEHAVFEKDFTVDKMGDVIAQGETCVAPLAFDGQKEYLFLMPVGSTPWYLCAAMPYGTIDSDIDNLTNVIACDALLVSGVILVAGILFFFMYYRTSKRTTRLLAEEKNRAEEAFAQAQKANLAKTEFLSRMSHEIRTPMNGIMGMTSIALESVGDDEKVRTCLEKVTISSGHLLSLINDILDMSKIESGKMEIKREPFDLATFIESLTTVFRTQAEEKGVSYRTAVGENLPSYLVGDPLRLNQVLYNLASNAFKFTPKGGSVVLGIESLPAQEGQARLRFTVADTGCGIESEHLDKIFVSFEQGNASIARKHGGTGLGLAITKRFVDLMGGRIRVTSIFGSGSTFTVDMPFMLATDVDEIDLDKAEEMEGHFTPLVPASNLYDFSDARMLIVEDNELNREIAVELMSMVGAQVETAATGKEAVDIFAASEVGHFDLVLMDVQMPEMDGYEASQTIRAMQRPDAASVVIVAMTADAFTEDVERSLASGMNGHLSKPLDIQRVYATINEFLKKRRN